MEIAKDCCAENQMRGADAPPRTAPSRARGRRIALGAATLVLAVIGWGLFRPELLFIDKVAVDDGPPPAARVLARGAFHSVAHTGKGEATLFEQPDGRRTLRFTNFETSNGPDVHVYLVAAADAADHASVTESGFIPLGPMKGNRGDQNYDVPDSVDLAKHRAVTIWCKRFGVNFATAPLTLEAQPR